MSLTEWSETLPDDNGFAGDGDDEIVAAKAGIKERLELDHQFSGELDPLEGDCDGYHKKLTMKALDDDPSPLGNTGVLYTKVVDGVVELFFKDELTGIANQMTEQGVLRLNTLQNDLDANGHYIKNIKTWQPSGGLVIRDDLSNYVQNYKVKAPMDILVQTQFLSLLPGTLTIICALHREEWTTTNSPGAKYWHRKSTRSLILKKEGVVIFSDTREASAFQGAGQGYPPYPPYPAYFVKLLSAWGAGEALENVIKKII